MRVKKGIFYWLTLGLIVFCQACSSEKKAATPLSAENKTLIGVYARALVKSINDYDHKLIRQSWSYQAFRERVKGLNGTQRDVFNYIFDKEIKDDITFSNVSLINEMNLAGGTAELLELRHFESHSELSIIFHFDEAFSLIRFRIAMVDDKPYLCDRYNFREEVWYSESIVNMINTNVRYDMFSEERHQANQALGEATRLLHKGDTLNALYYLYAIPDSHWQGFGLSLRRIQLASVLPDSTYAETLVTEYENNEGLYVRYLYAVMFEDSLELSKARADLLDHFEQAPLLDSAMQRGYFWN